MSTGRSSTSRSRVGKILRFHYIVTNRNDGHNMPSGSLGAQPQLWANVVLIGPRGQRLWESGYTDRWGDVADIHSEDVRNKRIPYDWQLFNLQTMFLITGATGTDREFFLAGECRHRPVALPASRCAADLGDQSSAVHSHGRSIARAARFASSPVQDPSRIDSGTRLLSTLVPAANADPAHLLHAILRCDAWKCSGR